MHDCKILLDHPTIKDAGLLFTKPVYIIDCFEPSEVENCLRDIEQKCQNEQLYAAGFLSYEAGIAFEQVLSPLMPSERQLPLLKFGLFKQPETLSAEQAQVYYRQHIHGEFAVESIKPLESKTQYCKKIDRLKNYIKAGDVYQANYTFQVELGFKGDLMGFYAALKRAQPTQLGGILGFDDVTIMSLSPELFFSLEADQLSARPMKGTAPRGKNNAEDLLQKNWLLNDEKNRAENLMIVDLLRNDLSRIAEIGSVKVEKLFDIETYDSLFQMTTSIAAKKRQNIGFPTLIKSLFPCGSITGAPKIRAMQIIDELEEKNRGVYCGSIGYLTPDGNANFNVAIRTITALKSNPHIMHLGVGSGIVYDSKPQDEYEECLLKMKFLTDLSQDYQLIESLLFDGQYAYFEEHLDRLCTSSNELSFSYDRKAVRAKLNQYAAQLEHSKNYKIRLLMFKSGRIELSHVEIIAGDKDVRYNIILSDIILEKSNIFTRHKTTKRLILDQTRERMKLENPDSNIDEVIFCNRQGYITEGSFMTIFVERDGVFYTPPLSAGLLNGVLRRHLLDSNPDKYKIKNIKFIDLNAGDTIYVGNSVRGLVKANLLD